MLALRSPITMGSWYRKRARASFKSGKCYKLEDGRYALMIRVIFLLVTTSNLVYSVVWNKSLQ